MKDAELIATKSNYLAYLLREHYRAQGVQLHELIASCEPRLPQRIIPKLNYVATIHNKAQQQPDFQLEDAGAFIMVCERCEQELQPYSSRLIWQIALLLIITVTAAALWFYI